MYNAIALLAALVISFLTGVALSTEIEGWKIPAIMLIVFAAVYGTAKKTY